MDKGKSTERKEAFSWLLFPLLFVPLLLWVLYTVIFVIPLKVADKIIDDVDRISDERKPAIKRLVHAIQTPIAIVLVIGIVVHSFILPYIEISPEPSAVVTASPIETPSPIYVYVTSSGEKYHRRSCQYLYSSCIEIELQKAIQKNYRPCSVCDPPE